MSVPHSLSFYSGNPNAKSNIAIIIHGTNSQAANMEKFAYAMTENSSFDAIYLFDDWNYFSMVNPTLSWADAFDFINPKKWVEFLGKLALRKLGEIVATPSFAVEGAAQTIASEIELFNFKDVCLIGHSLGGLVARCALESYDLRDKVRSLVTLGTPHYAWHESHRPNLWDETPYNDVPYLLLLGYGDFVCTIKEAGDITWNSDHKFENLYKIIYPGLDHGTIHTSASKTYVPEIIDHFNKKKGLIGKSKFYVNQDDEDYYILYYNDHHGPANRDSISPDSISGWIYFDN